MPLAVRSLAEARLEHDAYDGVITLEDPDFEGGLRVPADRRQLVHICEDSDFEDGVMTVPTPGMLSQSLEWSRQFEGLSLLVHCHEGKSRSTSTALAILAMRMGPGREEEAVLDLLAMRPAAVCNLLILKHADDLLKRDGALIAAWMRYEDSSDRVSGIRLFRMQPLARETSASADTSDGDPA